MNPLKQSQIEKLSKLGCADLARKMQEIIEYLNEDTNIICEPPHQEPIIKLLILLLEDPIMRQIHTKEISKLFKLL